MSDSEGSYDDYYMSDDGVSGSDGFGDVDDDGYGNAMTGVELQSATRADYQCLTSSEVREKQRDAVSRVIAVLQITPDEATTLLRAFKWNVNRVHDEWFQDESAVRARVGLSLAAQDAEPEYGDVATCRVCNAHLIAQRGVKGGDKGDRVAVAEKEEHALRVRWAARGCDVSRREASLHHVAVHRVALQAVCHLQIVAQ